jgi:HlyD family secretion protein
MRKWFLRLIIPVGVAAVVLRFTVFRPEPVLVKAVPVARAEVDATITNSKAGTVRARHRAKLSPEAGARVVEIAKREGAWVKKGEVLVHLNDATPRAQLQLAQASLRVAEAAKNQACLARDRAQRELNRKRLLAKERIVSDDLLDALESAYEEAKASCTAAAAERDKAEAAVAVAEAALAQFVIRAPFDGVIAELTAEVGEWITPSPPLLIAPAVLDIIDPTSLYVSAPMDEVDAASIRAGQRAKVSVDSHPGEEFAGHVLRVAPYVLDVEAQNRTVEIEVGLEDQEFASSLLPGTSADVELVLQVRKDVLRIPTSALLEGQTVLVPEDGKLVEQKVEIGLKNWDYAEVTSGLTEGELVVTSLDRADVKPGARVEVEKTTVHP